MLDHFIKYLAAYQPDSQVQDDQSQEDDQSQHDNSSKDEISELEESEPEEEAMEFTYPKRRRARVDLIQRRRRSSCAPIRPPYLPQYWTPHQYLMSMGRMSPPLVSVPIMFQPQPWMVANNRPMPPVPFWPNPAMTRFPYV